MKGEEKRKTKVKKPRRFPNTPLPVVRVSPKSKRSETTGRAGQFKLTSKLSIPLLPSRRSFFRSDIALLSPMLYAQYLKLGVRSSTRC